MSDPALVAGGGGARHGAYVRQAPALMLGAEKIAAGAVILIPAGAVILTPAGAVILTPAGAVILIPAGAVILIPAGAVILIRRAG